MHCHKQVVFDRILLHKHYNRLILQNNLYLPNMLHYIVVVQADMFYFPQDQDDMSYSHLNLLHNLRLYYR